MITGYLTIDDYLSAQRLHRKRSVLLSSIACLALLAIGLLLLRTDFNFLAIVFIAAGAGGLAGLITTTVLIPIRASRTFKQRKDFAAQFTYSWDRDYVQAESALGQAKRPWTNYWKIKESDEVFLLYHSDTLFEVLPKRWFGAVEQIDDFRSAAAQVKKT